MGYPPTTFSFRIGIFRVAGGWAGHIQLQQIMAVAKKTKTFILRQSTNFMNKQKILLAAGGVALIGVLFWGAKNNFSLSFLTGKNKAASSQDLEKARTVALDYIKNNLLQGQDVALEVKNVSEESGLYRLDLDVQGNQIATYMTKDLKMFFPNPPQIVTTTTETGSPAEQATQQIPQSDKPSVELFVMSYCPYGNEAETAIKPVVDLLNGKADLTVRYILNDKGAGAKPEDRFDSLHGPEEFKQDIREMCVQNNQSGKFWTYLERVNADCTLENISTCWKTAAGKVAVNTSQVETCYNQNAIAYGEQESVYSQENGVSGSPTLLINGVAYSGARSPEDYKQAICGAFNQAPEECDQTLSTQGGSASGGC